MIITSIRKASNTLFVGILTTKSSNFSCYQYSGVLQFVLAQCSTRLILVHIQNLSEK
ncbi:MAG: hypothetical protein IPK08_14270 [Bacteroidetes bacterium]|nr:hypothetical protein [Bacteroidota bacterium]